MAHQSFIAAAGQLCSTDDVARNLQTCRRLAASAAERGAALLVLPECFAFLGRRERDKMAVAERLEGEPGPILATLMELARNHQIWLLGGGMAERLGDDEPGAATSAFNTAVLISPTGALVTRYRKLHLFDVDIPGGATLRESDNTMGGDAVATVADTPLARLGLSICYDLRFPELYRQMVVRQRAQVLTIPAAFTAHTGAAHWHTLLRARAIENQAYVIAAAQYGHHNDKRHSYGHSLIIDPWGEIVAEVAGDEDGLAVATIDLQRVAKTRQQMPCLEHQRPGAVTTFASNYRVD